MKSIFDRIIDRELPASIIFEDDLVIAFLDIHPYNPWHTLVVPKFSVASLNDLPEDYASRMFEVARQIVRAMYDSSLRCDGVNLKLNDGEVAGQDVMHCHLHVIPRLKHDRLSSGFWVSGERWTEDRRLEMAQIAESIRAKLAM